MSARAALEAARETFDRQGVALVPGFLSATGAREIGAWVDALWQAPAVPGGTMKYAADQRLEYFRRFHSGLRALMEGPLADAAAALLGEPAVLFKDKVNFKLAGGSGFTPHQDAQAGWQDYAPLQLTVTVAIDAATPDNGCLEVARTPRLDRLVGERWKPLEGAALEALRFEPVPMQPGDALLFDSFAPHRSGPNTTTSPRRVLYVTYNALAHGDHYERYFADKRRSYPPDCEREPGHDYRFKV